MQFDGYCTQSKTDNPYTGDGQTRVGGVERAADTGLITGKAQTSIGLWSVVREPKLIDKN